MSEIKVIFVIEAIKSIISPDLQIHFISKNFSRVPCRISDRLIQVDRKGIHNEKITGEELEPFEELEENEETNQFLLNCTNVD